MPSRTRSRRGRPYSSSMATRDDLIPAQALFMSAQYLAALDIPTEWHMSAGVGHGIDEEGLRQGGAFLARRLKAPR